MVDGRVVEGELLYADDVIEAVVLWYREMEDHPPLLCIVTIRKMPILNSLRHLNPLNSMVCQ